MESAPPPPATESPSLPCWSAVIRKTSASAAEEPIPSRIFGNCNSNKGISVAVVDANAIIHGDKLVGSADSFVSVREVLDEVRDPVSRQRLAFLPFHVDIMEPSPESIKKVVKFARETGDLQTLSDVDLKLIALTYMLESQIHGTHHLRESPPPIHAVNVKNLHEAEMPGWGSNVGNVAEWEALDQDGEGGADNGSRILPLKDLSNDVITACGSDEQQQSFAKPRIVYPKKEIKIDGKQMVSDGIDASQGQDMDNADDWRPAVSRSTHRRYLRRQARRAFHDAQRNEQLCSEASTEIDACTTELDELELLSQTEGSIENYAADDGSVEAAVVDEVSIGPDALDEANTQASVDDASSEQSWMLRSLSDSSVACVTSDYAMQNVILQIGLRLLAPGGMQIRQLHRWVLKCHACNKVTQEVGRIFCPKCGNGGTLRKVSVTIGENGMVLAARRQRFILRGTKFSLPLPQGGRDAITKNPILREDQLPRKLLYPKTKKKSNKKEDVFFSSDDIFSHAGEGRAPFRPPVRKTMALFSGKRNPNDNHYSRPKN
ncbi:20S-pre-rRNA D-site endonuclease nob1 [Dioscorea cayenensis subsp. rotundata]|uniref:20S-pre-rRNA D-site endonuclease nob1 n=1 Tax=Dioscorea cayennensis subsp. rotundata TaxID=55577 RepID=A0AB40AIV2_DIOCR|nr:20S-pre-rRNA D-site endonuclease nob1 [Dioscorea cayenensis subsp. rotundata]